VLRRFFSTARSENPFTWPFWLGTVDPRPFALFRIGLGVSLIHDLFDYARDLRAFLADDGMLPRGLVKDWWTWGIFDLAGSLPVVALIYVLGCLAIVAFTLGWKTRLATIASWLFLSSLHHRNYYVTDGGDDLARILLFWAMFCDLGGAWSLDARHRATRLVGMPAMVPRLLQLHIGVLYFAAGRLKFRQGWLHNNVIYQTLQLDGFVRPLGGLMGRYPDLCAVLTRSICLMELAFAFFAFAPLWRKPTRAVAIALGLAIQLGILLTMRVGIFTEVMLWVCAMWLQPEWLDRAETWWRSRSRASLADERPTTAIAPSRLAQVLYPLLALQFVLAVWDQFAARRFPLPNIIVQERRAIDIVQPMGLFDVVYVVPRWNGPGTLTDGTQVEVLGVAAPGVRPRAPGLIFSRWNKFTFKEREHPYLFPALCAYLCRAFNERTTGPKLASFRLVDDPMPPHDTRGNAAPPQHREMWQQTCAPN
jgi:hypothetical protein